MSNRFFTLAVAYASICGMKTVNRALKLRCASGSLLHRLRIANFKNLKKKTFKMTLEIVYSSVLHWSLHSAFGTEESGGLASIPTALRMSASGTMSGGRSCTYFSKTFPSVKPKKIGNKGNKYTLTQRKGRAPPTIK